MTDHWQREKRIMQRRTFTGSALGIVGTMALGSVAPAEGAPAEGTPAEGASTPEASQESDGDGS